MSNTEKTEQMMAHNAVEMVCQVLGDVSTEQIWGKSRQYKIASARQLVYWHLYENCNLSYPEVGKAMGKTHATVWNGAQRVRDNLNMTRGYDKRVRRAAERLREMCASNYQIGN